MKKSFLALAFLPVLAHAQYRIETLSTPSGSVNPTGIAGGYVVGNTQTDTGVVSTLWSPGGVQTITAPDGATPLGFSSVNRLGAAIGTAGANRTPPQAFVWQNGAATFLANEDGDDKNEYLYGSRALGINDAGMVVGQADTAYGRQGVVWDGDDIRLLDGLDPVGEYQESNALAVNGSGQIAGVAHQAGRRRAVVWDRNGNVDVIGGLGDWSSALAINDGGTAVGWTDNASGYTNAFAYANGSSTLLQTLTGRVWAQANAVNNAGLIGGYCATEGNDEGTAVLWRDGQVVDLNALLGLSDWNLSSVTGIDDDGTIIGFGRYRGDSAAFRLTPVPEPASLAALGLGLAAVARRRSHRK